jgi:D-tyrosyl-tRNA(Tyr) deacylase
VRPYTHQYKNVKKNKLAGKTKIPLIYYNNFYDYKRYISTVYHLLFISFLYKQMRVCIQRVKRALVTLPVTGNITGEIGIGLLVLLGVGTEDSENEAKELAKKCTELRIFEDDAGKMNRSLIEVGGSMLVVSQFTLYANCRKGRRPSFTEAAPPDKADRLYQVFVETIRNQGISVATGAFRNEMHVELVNDGPVTVWIDTAQH